ncbi:hypothetical protein ACOSQ2_009993 [Xanthoceras sorbifolium]
MEVSNRPHLPHSPLSPLGPHSRKGNSSRPLGWSVYRSSTVTRYMPSLPRTSPLPGSPQLCSAAALQPHIMQIILAKKDMEFEQHSFQKRTGPLKLEGPRAQQLYHPAQ